MAKAKKAENRVIAGDYEGKGIGATSEGAYVITGFLKTFDLNKDTVESYELITDEHRKSAASGAIRGLVGGALLGTAGMLAGGLSATENGIYQMVICFKDGKRSLIEVDDKIYKAIVKKCF